jgi:SAM-dependent methyltransferase
MDITDYVRHLERECKPTAHLGGDRQGELHYMRQHAWRFKRLLSLLPRHPQSLRVLDIGPTPFTLYLKQRFPQWDLWALDRTDFLQQRFAAAGIRQRSCDLDQAHVPFADEHFDLVICTEVLEHVFAPPTKLLRDIKRTLRPSGRLLLSVPNLAILRKRLRFLFGISPLPDPDLTLDTHPLHGHGHVREYTRKEIVAACRSAGYELAAVRMIAKNPADTLRLMTHADCRQQVRHCFYLGKHLHAVLNVFTPGLRANVLIDCRKPEAVRCSASPAA